MFGRLSNTDHENYKPVPCPSCWDGTAGTLGAGRWHLDSFLPCYSTNCQKLHRQCPLCQGEKVMYQQMIG
jgi:hypothetical protein